MKALIASGGRGTRLRPITHTQNKHLIPIANKPILHYALEAVAEAGVSDVAIVHNADSLEVPNFIGDGSRWGIRITYLQQERPGGLAQVVQLAEDFMKGESFMFYLGDNMVVGGVKRFVDEFQRSGCNCLLTLAKVHDPERFGVPEIRDGKIIGVEEKPRMPKSQYAVAGIYIYDNHIFEAVKTLRPSARGELEISEAHQYLIDHGYSVISTEITGWWKDTGKPEDLLEANRLVLENAVPRRDGEVDNRSEIAGKVIIEPGARIVNSKIRGPVMVGRDCLIENSYIGPFTSIGDNTEIWASEVEFSIIMKGCKIHGVGARIEGSILGNDVEILETQAKPRVHRFMIGDQSRVEVA
ncbi:MAG: glucose-1-phosphate thymidylyltransferase [Ignavibacteria bacterium]|nr:glucose-1-phosphate thymidylyltransferase [Ignavibacteria bacterium]